MAAGVRPLSVFIYNSAIWALFAKTLLNSENNKMKVLYLFSGIRGALVEKIRKGDDPGGGTWGMVSLQRLGIQAEYVELEQWFSAKTSKFLRTRVLGFYGAHLPFFFKFFTYDIIFTAGAFTSQLVFTLVPIWFRHKTLWVMHDFSITGLLGEEKTFRQKMFRYMVAHAGGIVTVGKWETDELVRRFPQLASRIRFIPFGVDTIFFAPKNIPEEKLVIAVGVDPDRDWKSFFSAIAGLDAKVIIAGSSRRTKEFNPPDSVQVQFFEPKDMVDLYARASVVVIPLDTSSGVNDAMGCSTLYEAMSMGKAIVVSRTHTTESYIEDGVNGVLVPQHDAVAMRQAISMLCADTAKRRAIGAAARIYALEHLDMMECSKKLAAFFESLAVQKR